MKKLIVAILVIAGAWYWHKGGFTKAAAPVDANGNPVVVIFTASACGGPCQDGVNMLRERGVPFQEREIDPENAEDKDVKLWREVGNNILPLTLYGDSKVVGSSRWELVSLLGNNFGDKYLLPAEQVYFQQHFDASGSPRIVLYGTEWCTGCAALRKEFGERGVSYVDVDVEKSGDFANLTKVMEIPGYPAVWVGYTRVHGTTYDAVMSVANKRT